MFGYTITKESGLTATQAQIRALEGEILRQATEMLYLEAQQNVMERDLANSRLQISLLDEQNKKLQEDIRWLHAGYEAREAQIGGQDPLDEGELLDEAAVKATWERHTVRSRLEVVEASVAIPDIVVASTDLAKLVSTLADELAKNLQQQLLKLYMRAHYKEWLDRGISPTEIADSALQDKVEWNRKYQTGPMKPWFTTRK